MRNVHAPLALLLGLIWGAVWAAFLQFNRGGQWLASSRTWIAVVVGVGGNLVIARLLLPFRLWSALIGIFAVSSLPIIARSLHNELQADREVWHDLKG